MDFPYGHLYRCHQRRARCGHDARRSRRGNFRGRPWSRGSAPWNGRCRRNRCIGDRLTRLWFFQGQGGRRLGFRWQHRRSRYRCWRGYRFSVLRHRYRSSYRNCSRWRLRQIDLIALHQGRIGSNLVPSAEILYRYAVSPSYGCRSPGLSHRIGFYLWGLIRNRRRVWRFYGRFPGGKSLCVRRRVARQRTRRYRLPVFNRLIQPFHDFASHTEQLTIGTANLGISQSRFSIAVHHIKPVAHLKT